MIGIIGMISILQGFLNKLCTGLQAVEHKGAVFSYVEIEIVHSDFCFCELKT